MSVAQTGYAVRIFRVDPRRKLIRIPTLLGSSVATAGGLVALAAVATRHGDVARGCTPVIAVSLILLGLVRWTAMTTRLCLDANGVEFHVRGSHWRARWETIRSVLIRTAWEGTQPGGYSGGVRLVLVDGRARDIPDNLEVGRNELAAIIQARRAAAGSDTPA